MSQLSRAYQKMTDEQLMQRLAQGQTVAFNELYDRYHHRMLRYFFRMLHGDETRAQDLLQDLFLKVIEKADSYNSGYSFQSWIFTIASNMCKNEFRWRGVRNNTFPMEDPGRIEVAEDNDPDAKIDTSQFNVCLQEELLRLSPSHREVFILRYQEDLPIKEIAKIVECAEGTVKSRIFYATQKLAQCLKAFDPRNSFV